MSNDRYLSTVRALAMIGSVGMTAASCASTVVPLADGAVVDASDARTDVARVDSGSCPTMCPASVPPDGSACAAMLSCSYPSSSGAETYCYCNVSTGAACGAFRCSTAVPGPLPPPELVGYA